MDNVTLQVPMDRRLRDAAVSTANKLGFSSFQEVIRVFTTQFVKGRASVNLTLTPSVKLSSRNEKRYSQMEKDFQTGKNIFRVGNADEFLRQLNS